MAEQQTSSSRNNGRKAPPRRNDVIRCENCGEDYAVTYKRCPFCNEQPGRGGYSASGRRVANRRGGGYGGPVSPIQIAEIVISLIIIIAALFIVFKFIGGPLLGRGDSSTPGSASTSQGGDASDPSGSSSTQPGDTSDPDTTDPVADPEPAGNVQSITLSRTDCTLKAGERYQMKATLAPAGAEGTVTWTISDPATATIDENGWITNQNASGRTVNVTVTATCGDVTAQCLVRCRSAGSGTTTTPNSPATPVTPNSQGTIVNAEKGLNIRSGPGTDHEKVASARNGDKVTILGEENGWYKIQYSGTSTGYVSKDYVSVG